MLKCVVFFTLLHTLCFSNQADKAFAYYQSDDFGHAKEAFLELLNTTNNSEEKQIIENNLAVIEVKQANLKKAQTLFESISLDENTTPYVLRQIYLNTANLYHQLAIHNWNEINEKNALENIQESISILTKALEKIDSSIQEDQRTAIIEARNIASLGDETIETLRKKIKTLFLLFQEALQKNELKELSQIPLLERLHVHTNQSVQTLENAGLRALSPSLEGRFLKNLQFLQYQEKKYWDIGEKQIKIDQFTQAANLNREVLDNLKEGHLWPAKIASQKTECVLQIILNTLNDQDPLPDLLKQQLLWVTKKQQSRLPQFQTALKQEHSFLIALIDQYLNKQLQEIQGEKKIEKELLKELQKELHRDPFPIKTQADYHLALYNQVYQEETQTFLQQLKKPSLPYLRALYKKFEHRSNLEKSSQSIKIKTLLASQLDNAEKVWKEKEVQSALDQAFLLWDPINYLVYRLTHLQGDYLTLIKGVFPTHKQLKTLLDRSQETYQKCGEALEHPEYKDLQKEQIFHMLTNTINDTLQATQLSRNESQFYLKDASQWITRLLFLLNSPNLTGVDWLKEGISEEQFSIKQNIELQEFQRKNRLKQEMTGQLILSQKMATHQAETALTHLQKPEADKVPSKALLEAISLIQQGLKHAEKVFPYLELELPELVQVFPKQNDALSFWKKALKLLENQEGEKGEDNPKDEGDQSESEENQSPELPQPNQASLPQDLLELYQQMQQEDIPPSSEVKGTIKQGLRPW